MLRVGILALALVATPAFAQREPTRTAEGIDVTGATDPLEATIMLSTLAVSEERFRTDVFLRAFIDKKTRTADFQVYGILRADDPHTPNVMAYLVGGERRTSSADRISYDPSCYRYGCVSTEHVIATIPRADLEAMVAAGDELRARFSGTIAGGVDVSLPASEIQALLAAVDRRTRPAE